MSQRNLSVWAGALLAALPGPLLWALVAMGRMDPFLGSYIMVICVVIGIALVLLGPWLKLDPKTERFTGPFAKEANEMVTRNYREPFVVPDQV